LGGFVGGKDNEKCKHLPPFENQHFDRLRVDLKVRLDRKVKLAGIVL